MITARVDVSAPRTSVVGSIANATRRGGSLGR
jgi:hypothetical protein